MSTGGEKEPIRITLDDLAQVEVGKPATAEAPATLAAGPRSYGSLSDGSEVVMNFAEERGSLLLQGWFYLGVAGILGSVLGWAICEPAFVDGEGHRWGNTLMISLVVALLSMGCGIAESAVERSTKKALTRAALALPLGMVLGFIFEFVANIVFTILLNVVAGLGVQSDRNPGFWVARGIAWTVFGAAGGVVYGLVGQSTKKMKYGVIGGMIGAGLGGMVFDPIAMVAEGGGLSRGVGFALVGVATGAGMGIVESALKDRWLYVTAGPLAGKQFILYRARTSIGSQQQSDIYLFKDTTILPEHAVIEITGSRVQILAIGEVFVSGNPVRSRVLLDGDLVQLGRYTFRYKERHRS